MTTVSSRLIATFLIAIHIQACTQKPKEESSPTEQVTANPQVATQAQKRIEVKNGLYELADVLAWAMPTVDSASPESLSSLQDYNRFKGVISGIRPAKVTRFEGQIAIGVDGRRATPENIEDEYRWKASLDGPEVGANIVELESVRAVLADTGPAYLRKMGFELIGLACFSEGGTPTNATALYLAKYVGKQPTLMLYSVSTGSGGTFVNYSLHFGSLSWNHVPGATQPNFKGEIQPFGYCPYKNLI
jgi:hypothetical protein